MATRVWEVRKGAASKTAMDCVMVPRKHELRTGGGEGLQLECADKLADGKKHKGKGCTCRHKPLRRHGQLEAEGQNGVLLLR